MAGGLGNEISAKGDEPFRESDMVIHLQHVAMFKAGNEKAMSDKGI